MNKSHDILINGDALEELKHLPDNSIQTCVTSPPYYGLRDYGNDNQIGLEETPEAYVAKLVDVFSEVRRVLKPDGTLWLNLGDSYAGSITEVKPKNLLGMPWRVAFALQSSGWILRSDIIWHKSNAMPESVKDRPTKAHEYLFLLSKNERYYYDAEAVKEEAVKGSSKAGARNYTSYTGRERLGQTEQEKESGRNRRSVWTIATIPYKGAHFAVMPPKLVEPCILAGSREGDTVLDPFSGSGTVAMVARNNNRHYIGIELNKKYIELAEQRLKLIDNLWISEDVA